MAESDTYRLSRQEKILSGSKVTRRTLENAVQPFLQGTEINEIGLFRSGLPMVGRNPRYKMIDVTLTASISDQNHFMDVESSNDAGLGQDTYQKIEGTRYHRPGWVLDGQINLDPNKSTTIERVFNNLVRRGYTGQALSSSLEGYVRTVLKILSNEWEVGDGYISGSLSNEVYYVAGTYRSIEVADVKFPDNRVRQSISFAIPNEDFGYGKEHIDSVPYFDLAKYDAVEYIHNNGPTGMFPIVGSFLSYDEKLSYNGIIEPFEIRSRALGLNIFLEEESQPGSITSKLLESGYKFAFSHDSRENSLRSEFYEDVNAKGFSRYNNPNDRAAELLEAEFISTVSKTIYPFVERDNADLFISDAGIKGAQLGMDPTLDEGTLPITHIDSTVGFDAESRDRMNSMVFRGMTRR